MCTVEPVGLTLAVIPVLPEIELMASARVLKDASRPFVTPKSTLAETTYGVSVFFP